MLVSKLKKSVATLLSSRTREERLAAIPLIKAMVDVGGWEVLRGSEPWVRGMLSIIQVRPLTLSSRHATSRRIA